MTDNVNDNFISLHSKILSGDDLLKCIKGMPALLFRIEIAKNKIEYLNDYRIDGLGNKTFLLLKNKMLSKEIILEDDYPYYTSFIKASQQAKASKIIIRVESSKGLRWLKFIGSHNSYNPGFYLGVMMDITSSVEIVNEMNEKENENLAMINMLDNPVLLVDLSTKEIISHNTAAHELFAYSKDEFRDLRFNDLYHKEYSSEINKTLENVIFDKKWEGKLFFKRKDKNRFLCNTSLRTFKIKTKLLLSISIYSIDLGQNKSGIDIIKSTPEKLNGSAQKYLNSLLNKVSSLSEMKKILDVLIENPYPGMKPFDGIIYSDIQVNKDKVVVYPTGSVFKNLPFGEVFTYDGTIAENIEQYKLKNLIVDDTMSSTKAIDWALFIPSGIRSYYARPFFERNTLRSILILCSKKPYDFNNENIDKYDLLCAPFTKGLKNWRKLQRTKKANR